jgi:hypothetical protein
MQVPEPLAGDVAAQNARSVDAMLACFTDAPVVRDERREVRGTSTVRGWMALDRDRIARPEIDG